MSARTGILKQAVINAARAGSVFSSTYSMGWEHVGKAARNLEVAYGVKGLPWTEADRKLVKKASRLLISNIKSLQSV